MTIVSLHIKLYDYFNVFKYNFNVLKVNIDV